MHEQLFLQIILRRKISPFITISFIFTSNYEEFSQTKSLNFHFLRHENKTILLAKSDKNNVTLKIDQLPLF